MSSFGFRIKRAVTRQISFHCHEVSKGQMEESGSPQLLLGCTPLLFNLHSLFFIYLNGDISLLKTDFQLTLKNWKIWQI